VAQIELVGSEYNPAAEAPEEGEKEAPKKSKGLGERLRQTAQRMRGGKGDAGRLEGAGRWTDEGRGPQVHDSAEGRRIVVSTSPRGDASFE
jgi:hypothetical protein